MGVLALTVDALFYSVLTGGSFSELNIWLLIARADGPCPVLVVREEETDFIDGADQA
jgi:hypothetical protein